MSLPLSLLVVVRDRRDCLAKERERIEGIVVDNVDRVTGNVERERMREKEERRKREKREIRHGTVRGQRRS